MPNLSKFPSQRVLFLNKHVAELAAAVLLSSCIALLPDDNESGTPVVEEMTGVENVRAAQTIRLRQALGLASTRLWSGVADEASILNLLDEADNYSEAMLLARSAAGAFNGPTPALPQEVLDDVGPQASSMYVFEGWNIVHSDAVTERLEELRKERDEWLQTLTDEEFVEYADAANAEHKLLRKDLTENLGRTFDDRPDIGVMEALDGSIWRLKQVPQARRTELRSSEPGGRDLTEAELQFALLGGHFPDAKSTDIGGITDIKAKSRPQKQIVGTDQRVLRSRYNSYLMNTQIYGPLMLLMHENGSTNPSGGFINLDCSGTKVSARVIITAGHCLFVNGSWNSTKRFVPGADGIGKYGNSALNASPNGYDNSVQRYAPDNWVDHEWGNYDFGTMVLSNTSPLKCWWWRGVQENISGLTGDFVHLYGYPGEGQNCGGAGSPRTDDKCGASIYGSGDNVISGGGFQFQYNIDTQAGQSGAGVYKISGDNRTVYGVHRGEFGAYNEASRLNETNYNTLQGTWNNHPPNPPC